MHRIALVCCVALALPACDRAHSTADADAPCSEAWLTRVEQQVSTGDGAGHGPDVGSDEWRSVVEFRLGIRGAEGLPPRDSDDWCRHVDRVLAAWAPAADTVDEAAASNEPGPSFDCTAVEPESIAARVCDDADLAALDRKLAGVYAAASAAATNEHPPVLQTDQRGWIKGRDECWKSDDVRECVRSEYVRRIAELQARYRLVDSTGPVRFGCNGNPANEVVVTYFATEPPTLIAEHGDRVSLMYQRPSGSGARYQGRNELFWEHRGEAAVRWGFEAPEMRCVVAN